LKLEKLISVIVPVYNVEEYLDELQELASACDVKVVGRFFQKRSKPDPVFLIGSGKIQELALTRQVRKANLLIFA